MTSSLPCAICDYCSKLYYDGDFLLKQTSNECHNVFKLEFCNMECLQKVEKDFPFVRHFEFERKQILSNESEDNDEDNDYDEKDIIINEFFRKYPSFILNQNGDNVGPKKSYEIIENFCKMMFSKNKEEMNEEEISLVEFSNKYSLFDYCKIKLI